MTSEGETTVSQENIQLLFEAGRAAANRNWPNAQIVSIDQLDDQTPAGPPLVIAAESHSVTPSTAKTLAALAGAGRHVLLVTDQPLPDNVNSWLPADTVLVIGQEPASASPGTIERRTELQHIILTRLADDPVKDVRGYMARNPHTPPDVLARLAADPDIYVRRSVASNPHTPTEALARLAADPDIYVRQFVAGNPHTPSDVLARLADDPDTSVRSLVVVNPATPMAALEQMASSVDAE